MRRGPSFPGTGVRRSLDTRRLAEALKMPGIDPRLWVSYGTVGTVDDDGNVDPSDWMSIYNGPEGLEVDVLLEPLRIPAACHYYGVAGGRAATISAPIRPGDLVLVTLPSGDVTDMPVIVAVMHSAAHPQPLGTDRLPIYRNDRIFVWGEDVPIDVRTKGGARALFNQDGTIVFNDGDEGVARKTDPVRVTFDEVAFTALVTALAASGVFVTTGPPPYAPPVPAPAPYVDGVITDASATVKSG